MPNPIFDQVKLPCGAAIKNRIAKTAMTEGLASCQGEANESHEKLYQTWAKGGAGLLISGNIMIDKQYLERPGNVIIDDKVNKPALRRWTQAATINNTHLWAQISHPGRQCTRWVHSQPIAPSNTPLELMKMFNPPRALGVDEIKQIRSKFAKTAAIAQEVGFTGVQIHAAHGYLISQFLSPLVNTRDDEYGGSLANRARFLLEVIHEVRQSVGPNFPLAVKLNSADFQKGGFTIDECIKVVEWLNQTGIDLLEISGGTYEQPQLLGHEGDPQTATRPQRQSTIAREAYFVEYAKQIRAHCKIPLMVTGGFETEAAMLDALHHVDLLGIARPFCVTPSWPSQWQKGKIQNLKRPEKNLCFRGFWGPTSPLRILQAMNIQGEVAWFYQQIIRLSQGKEPKLNKNILNALACHAIREQKLAFLRRRFLKAN